MGVLVGVNVGVFVGVFVAVLVGVGITVGVGVDPPEHNTTADALLRGTGAVITSKSRLLLFVSVHPAPLRTPPCVDVSDMPLFTDVPPSPFPAEPFPAAPYATQSTIRASCAALQGIADDPQVLIGSALVTRAIFPLEADIAAFVVTASGVTGNWVPEEPADPSWTR